MPTDEARANMPPVPDAATTNKGTPWWARNSDAPYLTPKQVRSRTVRGTAGVISFSVIFLLGIYWVLTSTAVKEVEETEFGGFAYKQTTDALIGGCGPMYEFPEAVAEAQSGTVPQEDENGITNRLFYNTVVPMFGKFWDEPVPMRQRFWSGSEGSFPMAENLMRNMWNGDMIIYYTSTVDGAELVSMKRLAQERVDLDIIVVPWELKVRGPLPQNREIAFATWNASQTCHQFVAPAVFDFRERYPSSRGPGNDGDQPKKIPGTTRGSTVR